MVWRWFGGGLGWFGVFQWTSVEPPQLDGHFELANYNVQLKLMNKKIIAILCTQNFVVLGQFHYH